MPRQQEDANARRQADTNAFIAQKLKEHAQAGEGVTNAQQKLLAYDKVDDDNYKEAVAEAVESL